MPVGFNSPARNLFLLGSSGEQVVTNFFKTIDQSAGTDGVYLPSEIKYNFVDQKFILAGSASNSNSKAFGWFEKRDQAGSADWDVRVEATSTGVNTTLRAMELDSNDNLIVVGKTGDVPWIAKYSNGGVIDWQSTTNSGDVGYTGITSDSNGNYYACGNTPDTGDAQAFVEKFDTNGNPGWGKSAFMLGRDVVLKKIAANSRGEVVAVGWLIDDVSAKGYIVKIDTNTGEVLWDRTIKSYEEDISLGYKAVLCEGVYIDSKDQIYVVGRLFSISSSKSFIIKYTAEGNMLWQRETEGLAGDSVEHYEVKSDGETEQTVVLSRYFNYQENTRSGMLSKYSKDGTLVWRRTIISSYNLSNTFAQTGGRGLGLDADPSFYYLIYIDDVVSGIDGYPDRYTYGKVSSSGNGLGAFEYTEGTGETVDYEILNIQDKIGRLSDGSVRNDTSDLITYPFNANNLLFDDLATQVANKRRQMDNADSFEYSGSPAIRPADFSDVNAVAGETTIPAQNRQNMIGRTQNMVPEDYGNVDDYTRRWRGQSTTVVVDYGFAGPYDVPEAAVAVRYALTAATGRRLEYAGPTLVQDQVYTFSIWMKRIASDANWNFQAYVVSALGSAGDFAPIIKEVDFYGNTIKTISLGTNTYTPTDDDWHRISWTFKSGANSTIAIGGYDGSGSTGNKWYLYGAQFVDGTLPLQYHAISDAANGGLDPRIDTLKDTTPPVTGGYFDFTGNDSAQDMIEFPPVDYRDAVWSAEAWIYIPSTWTSGSQYPNIISQGGSAGWDTPGWSLYCFRNYGSGTGYTIGTGMRNRGGTLGVNGVAIEILNAGDQPTNTWIHAVATCDGTTRRLYINGTEVANGSQTISFFDQNELDGKPLETVKIGGGFNVNGGFRNYFPGRIGEARSYGRALTAAQVFQNYNATKTKYTNEAPDTAPKIGPGIVYDSNLLLNYDFGNRATYDSFANRYDNPSVASIASSEIKIIASDGAANDYFGYSVAVGEDRIVVGAFGDDDNGTTSGSAYTYDLDGTQLAKITASDGANLESFGHSVAVGSGKIVVGAFADNDNGSQSGSAYIYDLDGTNEVKITPSDGASGDNFGRSVAVGSGKIVVGAHFDALAGQDPGYGSGSAYIFDLDGTQIAKITASDNASFDRFGQSVAVGSGRIVVGANLDDDNGLSSGSAYIFDLDGTQLAKITASDAASGDNFGISVAVGSGRIVVGAHFDDDNGSSSGSAYIYDLDGNFITKIIAFDGAATDYFGYSVAVVDGKIVVGARIDDDNGSDSGSAYIFDLDGNFITKIIASDGASGDNFGYSVAVGDGKIVVGAYQDDDNGSSSGSAYVYSFKLPLPTTVKNLSSSSYTGTINGTTFNPAGYFEFAGAGTGKIDVPNTLTMGETFTISVWVNADDLSGRTAIFSTRSTNTAGGWQLEVGTGDTGSNRIGVAGVGTWIYRSNNDVLTTGTWYHITLVKANNSTDAVVYLNGSSLAAADTAAYTISNNSNVRTIGLGTNGSTDTNFDGKIGELQYYNRVLTATEVSQNFNATKSKYGV